MFAGGRSSEHKSGPGNTTALGLGFASQTPAPLTAHLCSRGRNISELRHCAHCIPAVRSTLYSELQRSGNHVGNHRMRLMNFKLAARGALCLTSCRKKKKKKRPEKKKKEVKDELSPFVCGLLTGSRSISGFLPSADNSVCIPSSLRERAA